LLCDPGKPGDFQPLQFHRPFVVDDGIARSLHFTRGELQSRMLTHSPWQLALDYTRTMMGFLLFNPAPAHIGMVGLGGGSLARFCHRFLPASRMTVLEINPHVIALRDEFEVPGDGERFQVVAADAALYLRTEAPRYDVLLVDGFDHEGQPAALCTQRFYDDCLDALPGGGVLAVNLHYGHPDYPLLLARISRSFGGHALEVISAEQSNSIVFARKGRSMSPRRLSLAGSLAALAPEARAQLRPDLARMLWQMREPDGPDS
jgi:spermidine synthase